MSVRSRLVSLIDSAQKHGVGITIALLVVVWLAMAMTIITNQYKVRELVNSIEQEQEQSRRLQDEWRELNIELAKALSRVTSLKPPHRWDWSRRATKTQSSCSPSLCLALSRALVRREASHEGPSDKFHGALVAAFVQ